MILLGFKGGCKLLCGELNHPYESGCSKAEPLYNEGKDMDISTHPWTSRSPKCQECTTVINLRGVFKRGVSFIESRDVTSEYGSISLGVIVLYESIHRVAM